MFPEGGGEDWVEEWNQDKLDGGREPRCKENHRIMEVDTSNNQLSPR